MKVVDFEVVAVVKQAHEVKQAIAVGPALEPAGRLTAKVQSNAATTIE
jgi:primosomal replication protein N